MTGYYDRPLFRKEYCMKKLLLTDGNAMLFRAYYATAYGKKMTTKDGTPTNAVFGFASMLQKAIDIVHPDAMFVAFDYGKHTFRHELYKDYKGGRRETPEDLIPQFSMARDFLSSFGIAWQEMEDIEADDLIGTVSKKYPEYQTYILTSDHDLLQLVDESTTVLLMKKGLSEMDLMTPEKIQEEMGIDPVQIIDLKGLMGDTSDNYPGIAGVGEKTALKLIKQYGSVEEVLDNAENIKGALGKKVQDGKENARLSKTLATIRRDVPLDLDVETMSFTPDYEGVVNYLKSLDMQKLSERFANGNTAACMEETVVSVKESFIRTDRLPVDFLSKDIAVYLDDDLQNFISSRIYGFAFSDGKTGYYMTLEALKNDSEALHALQDTSCRRIGYDIKRSAHLLENEGVSIAFTDDVMIMASLVNSDLTSTEKCMDYFNMPSTYSFQDVYGKPSKPILIVDEEKQNAHACVWANFIYTMYEKCAPVIQENHLEDVYSNVELPVSVILEKMEKEGIYCDIPTLDAISEKTEAEMQKLQQEIYGYAGKEFNLNSPKQMSEVLFDDLGLYAGKKKSTSAETLMKLQGAHPIIDPILRYRKLAKIYSTYSDGLKKFIRKDGKIHTTYNQCATTTGRLSSSEPNLQNISVRDEEGREIRKAFLPEEKCVLLSCDYHQIELRILAHMAKEESLIKVFQQGIDIHTQTAMDVFGKTQEEVTSQDRRKAKAVNFGIVYGISDFGLAEQLHCSRKEANEFIEKYYEAYPGIKEYMHHVVKFCEENGYVETLMGRRREIPEIHDSKYMVREFGKRAAMNAPIQGSAAELIKLAMIQIDKALKDSHLKSKMLLQVHDELIFNVPEEEIEVMQKLVQETMEHAMTLSVPLTVECAVGKTWYEAK